MKILVTGASGFLGSHVCRCLAAEGHALRILCRPTSDLSHLRGLDAERTEGNVTDPNAVRRAVAGCDAVIHCAATVSYTSRDAAHQAAVNVDGTRHLAQACRREGVKRLVHTSTATVIGIPQDPRYPANEGFTAEPTRTCLLYPISKRRAEEAVQAEVAQGLDAVIVNPTTIFGQNGSRYRGLEMIEKVRSRRVVPYFSGGFSAVFVQDVARGVAAALQHGEKGQRYLLGGENITYRALAERAAEAMHLRRCFVRIGPLLTATAALLFETVRRSGLRQPPFSFVTHYYGRSFLFYDSSKARTVLSYAPRDFNAILEDALRFLRARPAGAAPGARAL